MLLFSNAAPENSYHTMICEVSTLFTANLDWSYIHIFYQEGLYNNAYSFKLRAQEYYRDQQVNRSYIVPVECHGPSTVIKRGDLFL